MEGALPFLWQITTSSSSTDCGTQLTVSTRHLLLVTSLWHLMPFSKKSCVKWHRINPFISPSSPPLPPLRRMSASPPPPPRQGKLIRAEGLGAPPTPPPPLIADNHSMACEWNASVLSPILDFFYENLSSIYYCYLLLLFLCYYNFFVSGRRRRCPRSLYIYIYIYTYIYIYIYIYIYLFS
jgi:hypothetical protein